MPHTKSAKKRLRQSEERRVRNKTRTTEIKTLGKQILRAVHDGQPDEAKKLYARYTKHLDRAASMHVIHANAAARSKSRMARVITGGPAAAAAVVASRGHSGAGPAAIRPTSGASA